MAHHAIPDRTDVIVVGSMTADVTTFSERVPERGETILGDEFTLVLGGKGANQAIAAGRAGAPSHMVGCVGDDLFRDTVRAGLDAAGVGTDFVREVAGAGTGIAHIRVDAAGENDIVMVPRANAELGEADIDRAFDALGARCTVMLTQLETPHRLTRHAVRRAAEAGVTVVLDPAPAHPLDDDIWRHVDFVTPNETEAKLLTGIEVSGRDDAVAAGRWFTDRGAGCALVTLAGDGAVAVTADDAVFFEPIRVEVVDTTAAGDAFAGCLAAGLAEGRDRDEAIRRAIAAGALAVTKAGASPSIPARDEIDAVLGQGEAR
ncbi:ribokinase [Microbacterium suaedae]|uniref:ribokinase n=1 Tax=Microbacterium suaedae TaxID=2067813 RepID=UPI000DA23061|nr:ribokinase [Microbacterium suaedae]